MGSLYSVSKGLKYVCPISPISIAFNEMIEGKFKFNEIFII